MVAYSGDANNVARTTSCSDTNAFTFSTTKVSATPTPVVRGGTLTVAWSGITAPTSGDWVGLYRVGTPDGGLVATWKYTTGTATGSMALKFPWITIAGQYEVRLMADNTSRRLATSATDHAGLVAPVRVGPGVAEPPGEGTRPLQRRSLSRRNGRSTAT